MNRVVQPELLDALAPRDPRAARSRRDIQRLNLLSGHDRLMARELRRVLVASAILADVEPGFQPGGKKHVTEKDPMKLDRLQRTDDCSGRQDAALSGRPGGPPLLPKPSLVELGAGNGCFFLRVARRLGNCSLKPTAILVDRADGFDPHVLPALKQIGWTTAVEIADVFDWLRGSTGKSREIIFTNQFLHQFESGALAEMFLLISKSADTLIALDPSRDWLSLICSHGVGLVGCGAVTRYDAPVSVRAGFNGRELSALWPDRKNWELTERRAGLFSHLFIARRKT